jgi:acyl-CoA thioesterase-1
VERRRPLAACLLFAALACGADEEAVRVGSASGAAAASPEAAPLVVFLGDSLTAGLGLAEAEAFPALVGAELREEGFAVRVVNAGVSGDTTAGGLARLDWLLAQGPAVVVVGLGANDGLRGLPLEATEANLREIVRRSREAGARVVLLGMRIPLSYGLDYAGRFERLYEEVADDLDVPLVPFLLDGVAARPALNLPDRIHPNARGHARIAETVYPYVEEELEEALE